MELEDFLGEEFALYFADNNPNLVVSTTNVIKNYKGVVDRKNPPQEKTITMSKKKFAEAFQVYAEALGYKELTNHPCRFCKDYGLDMYRGEQITPATKFIKEWLEMTDAH